MTDLELTKETALIEAILYLEGEGLDEAALSRISGFSREIVEKTLEKLSERYTAEHSGLELSRIGGGFVI